MSAQTQHTNARQDLAEVEHPHSVVEISVQDTGIGLEKKDLERIFHAFEQVERIYTRRYEGAGLGLSLSKKMVELHGGRIWAESEGKGKGATFRFVLPIASHGVME